MMGPNCGCQGCRDYAEFEALTGDMFDSEQPPAERENRT